MKRLLSISIVFMLLLSNAFGQNGFKLIQKAQRNAKFNFDKRALNLLSKADSANYGFCGNAWAEGTSEIAKLRAIIYRKQPNPEKLRMAYNLYNTEVVLTYGFTGNYEGYNETNVMYAIDAFGKEKVREALEIFMVDFIENKELKFNHVTNLMEVPTNFMEHPLHLIFDNSFVFSENILQSKSPLEVRKLIIERFKKELFFKLIYE